MINPEKLVTSKTLIGITSDRFGKHMTKVQAVEAMIASNDESDPAQKFNVK
jgi:hypothetical protein